MAFLLLTLAPGSVLAVSYNFNGSWQTRDSKDGVFEQGYRQIFNVQLRQEATRLIDVQESFRYTKSWAEGGGIRETINPLATVSLNNDLFQWDLSGNLVNNRSTTSANTTSSSWQSTWTSNWLKPLWPSLRLNLGQTFSEDDETPRTTDTRSTQAGSTVDWDLRVVQLTYTYDWQKSLNKLNSSENRSANHQARLTANRTLFHDRLNLSLAEQFNQNRRKSFTPVAGGTAELERDIYQVLAVTDSTPLDNTDTSGNRKEYPAMLDNDLLTVAFAVNPPTDLNIVFKINSQKVNKIYLYTADQLSSSDAAAFVWDLYASNDIDTWSKEASSLSASYSTSQKRFEIDLPVVQRTYLKLVIRSAPSIQVRFSEAKASDLVSTSAPSLTETRDSKNFLTTFNASYRLSRDLLFSYSVSHDANRFSDAPDIDRLSQVGSLDWAAHPLLKSVFSISDTWNQTGEDPKSANRSYALNLISPLLPTLNISTGLSRNETYEGSTRTKTAYSYDLFTTAQLYRDLDSSLELIYTTAKDEKKDTTSKDFDSKLDIGARLWPGLTTSFTGEYDFSKGPSNHQDTVKTSLDTNWRLSDPLSVRLGLSRTWDSDEQGSSSATMNLAFAPTPVVQLSMSYVVSESDSTTQSISSTLSWTIAPQLLFRTSGSYSTDSLATDNWSVNTNLTLRFAKP